MAPAEVLRQAASWRARYGIEGVFLDQVANDERSVGYLALLCPALCLEGAEALVLNPGTPVVPEVMALADIVCTFEGACADYVAMAERPWEQGDERVAHLVHSVGAAQEQALAQAAQRHRPAVLAAGAARGTSSWGVVRWPGDVVTAAGSAP